MKLDVDTLSIILLSRLKKWTLDPYLERDLYNFYNQSTADKISFIKKYPIHIQIMMKSLMKEMK